MSPCGAPTGKFPQMIAWLLGRIHFASCSASVVRFAFGFWLFGFGLFGFWLFGSSAVLFVHYCFWRLALLGADGFGIRFCWVLLGSVKSTRAPLKL